MKTYRVWRVQGSSWNLDYVGTVKARGPRSAMTAARKRWGPGRYKVQIERGRRMNPDESMRRRGRRRGEGAREEAAYLRDRLRTGTITTDAVRLAAQLGHVPAQIAMDVKLAPEWHDGSSPAPYSSPDGWSLVLAQDNEWGHYMSALWAYACVKGTKWIWDEINGPAERPRISQAPDNALRYIEKWLGEGDPCPRAESAAQRIRINAFRDRLDDLAHDLDEAQHNETGQDHEGCTCEAPDRVTCGNCDRSWCNRCDPAGASWACHWCHGRGFSDAELTGPGPGPAHAGVVELHRRLEAAREWLTALLYAVTIWGENMHGHWGRILWGTRETISSYWDPQPKRVSFPLWVRSAQEAYRDSVWAVDIYRGGDGNVRSETLDLAQLDVERWAREIALPRILR